MPKFPQAAGASANIYGGFRGTEAYRSELAALRSGGASAASNATIDFPDLTRPYSGIAPPRSLSPQNGGPIWRSTMNMIPRDGLMRRRPGVASFAPGGPTPALTAGTNQELPVFVYNYTSPLDLLIAGGSLGSGGCPFTTFTQPTAFTIMVTNRQAYIYSQAGGASWKNVTPKYTTGTLSVTNGSTLVTGLGTTWFTAGLTPFNHILIGGVWYQICAINTDTSLDLTTAYAGSTAGGLTYTVQRTWDFPSASATSTNRVVLQSLIYVCLFNQNLYIAGNYVGGAASGSREPAIIKVSGIFGASPTSSYILGRAAVNPGQDNLPTLNQITGIQCLQDGRVVVSGCTDSSEGVIFYSSNLVDNVWSAPPGGNTPVVVRPGPIYALGKLGNNLTLHYQDGIVLGIPTGLADPPLAFQNTPATVGCYSPRTLQTMGGVEIFMSADANIFTFDGNHTVPIGNEIRNQFAGASALYMQTTVHAAVNHRWNEYTIYSPFFSGLNSGDTNAFTFRVDDGSWWQLYYPVPIGAAADAAPTTPDYAIIGLHSYDNGTIRPMMWALSSTAVSDGLAYALAGIPQHRLETDDLDFGQPMNYKTADSCVVFLRAVPAPGSVSLQMAVSRDGGTTWITSSLKSIVLPTTGETPIQFSFRDAIGAGPLLRYRLILGTAGNLTFAPTRLLVDADIGGDIGLVQL